MTFTIDLSPEVAEQVRADAQAQNLPEADLLRELVENNYARRTFPPPGFAAYVREAREVAGDLREGSQILREMRDAESAERDALLGIRPKRSPKPCAA